MSSVIPGEEEALLSTREGPGHGGCPQPQQGTQEGLQDTGQGPTFAFSFPPAPGAHGQNERGSSVFSCSDHPCSCLPVANLDIMKPPKTRVLQLVLGPVSGE